MSMPGWNSPSSLLLAERVFALAEGGVMGPVTGQRVGVSAEARSRLPLEAVPRPASSWPGMRGLAMRPSRGRW